MIFVSLLSSYSLLPTAQASTQPDAGISAGAAIPSKTGYPREYHDKEAMHNQRVAHPYAQLIPALKPNVPLQVKPHSRLVLTDIEDRAFFDAFAWQTFIGLVWPVDPQHRGVPNSQVITPEDFLGHNKADESNSVPVVWESFRNATTAFPNPPADAPEPAQPPAWNANTHRRPISLSFTSKGQHPHHINEAFSSPLIDQNRQYVRYNIRINEVMYEYIRQNGWYLKKNLPKSPTQASLPPLALPDQSISQPQTQTVIKQPILGNSMEIKSAWRILITAADKSKPWRKVDDLSRYFVLDATVDNAVTEKPESVKVGLVGLHVVVKTPQFKQGIWASFEHIDNLKVPKNSGLRPSFHNGTNTFYKTGYSYQPKTINKRGDAVPEASRIPVEVSRIYKIPDTPMGTPTSKRFPDGYSTQGLNKAYQALLKGTVWQYFQLVITQWPTDPSSFYAKPFIAPRGLDTHVPNQPSSVKQAVDHASKIANAAYPRWAGLPIPQIGALNTIMETYFQNPSSSQDDSNAFQFSSCMGCHYGASDMDFSWILKTRTWPQPFNQGRIDNTGISTISNTEQSY